MTRPVTDDDVRDALAPRFRQLAAHDLPSARTEALRGRCRCALRRGSPRAPRVVAALRFALPAGACVLSAGLVTRILVDALAIFGVL